MRTHLVSTVLLAFALGASATFASSSSETAYAFRVSSAKQHNGKIEPGSSRATVRLTLGLPHVRLSPDVYIYHDFHVLQDVANENGCDSLVVTFKKGMVVDLKLVNRRAVQVIAAGLRTKPSATVWVAATGTETPAIK